MQLISDSPGHAVWLRTKDNGLTWETACHCGFRSNVGDKAQAAQEGHAHFDSLPKVTLMEWMKDHGKPKKKVRK